MNENCSLLVCSCDKYSTAWYPYFELIKKYWPEHPQKIYLNTETKQYRCEGLDIQTINSDKHCTWSERLYHCLTQIDTKYVVFSLEDFFLLGYVDQKTIDQCMQWMEEDGNIAVCRLYHSNLSKLKKVWKNSRFRIAESNIQYRLDTQVALWNRETLLSFLDKSENPWQFEEKGSKRVANSKKTFLWLYHEKDFDIDGMVFPYGVKPIYGYGIAWGRWLWKNKEWFKKNGITGVNMRQLGVLSEKSVKRRFRILYNPHPTGTGKLVKPFYRILDRAEKVGQNIRIYGFRNGLKISSLGMKK